MKTKTQAFMACALLSSAFIFSGLPDATAGSLQNVTKKDLAGKWDLRSVKCSNGRMATRAVDKGTFSLREDVLSLELYEKSGEVSKAFETKLFSLQENLMTVPVKDTYATFEIKRQGKKDLVLRFPVVGPMTACPEGNLLVMNFRK